MEILIIFAIIFFVVKALRQPAAGANLENARIRAQRKVNDLENRFAGEQIRAGRMEAHTTSILDRAKANATGNLEDVTLNTMEEEHAHSERVSSAEHHHPEDVVPENMLGTIEDLMIKGYDGNLCFERDFVGEALDMLSRFTVSSEVPDFMDTHRAV